MLEIRGAAPGLLDDPLALEVGGAPPGAALTWRTRLRDDDGFVWRGQGPSPDALAWTAKASGVAALRSLRPVELDVRVELDDQAASRTITRTMLAPGVKVRRWRGGDVTGTLYLPPPSSPSGASRDDATATIAVASSLDAPWAPVAAALLASRGVAVFLASGDGDGRAVLAALPDPPARIETLDALPPPPGLPSRAPAEPAAWDALLAALAARPRRVAR